MIPKRKWVEDNSENESKTDAKSFTAGQPERKTEPCSLMCVVVLISCVWEGLDKVSFWPTSISFDLHWELSHFKSNSPAQSTCVHVYIFGWMCKHMQLCVSSHASFYTGVCVLMLDCCCVCVWMLVCLSTCVHVHTSRYTYPLPDGCLLALLFPCSVCVWLLTVWTVMCDRSHFRDPIITSA